MKDNTDKKGRLLSDKEYQQLIKTLSKGIRLRKRKLKWCWETGRSLNELGKPPRGEALVQKIAKDMGTTHATLYNCKRFHTCWPTEAELEELLKKNVLWSHILSLVNSWLTDDERRRLLKQIEKKHLTGKQLSNKVRAKVRAKKKNWCRGH